MNLVLASPETRVVFDHESIGNWISSILANLATSNDLKHITSKFLDKTYTLDYKYRDGFSLIASLDYQSIKDNIYYSDKFNGLIRENTRSEDVSISGLFTTEKQKIEFANYLETFITKTDYSEDQIPITFWMLTPHGIRSHARILSMPSWNDIKNNYNKECELKLDYLMKARESITSKGKLLIFFGKPGVGKTYTIRALSREWKEWCNFHYITDPDNLFGRDSNYVLDLMFQMNESIGAGYINTLQAAESRYGIAEVNKKSEEKWNLLIVEDAGDLISIDAKSHNSSGLARLLNMTDGILGQGIKLMVLITANQDFEKLNKASIRYGRCITKIEFPSLTEHESKSWLEKEGISKELIGDRQLSELYGIKYEGIERKDKPSVGFIK